MTNDARSPDGRSSTTPGSGDETAAPQRLGQLVPAVVGALAILIVLAVRGTANPPSPLAIFAFVAVVAAVVVAAAAMIPDRFVKISGSTRVSAWNVAVRTAYLALAAAALYVVQEIIVSRLGDDAIAKADELLALELLALLLIALFVARPVTAIPTMRRRRRTDSGPNDTSLENAVGVLYGLLVTLAILTFSLVAFALAPEGSGLGAIGTGLAVAAGALGVGALLGVLFGIPRSLQSPQTDTAPAIQVSSRRYRANTNLEEISDWLTKIIVGVSLTQLGEIQTQLAALVVAVAAGFGGSAEAQAFVFGLLTSALIAGFLAAYLLARLYLPRALLQADPDEMVRIATEQATAAAEKKVEEVASATATSLEDQVRVDTEATRLATLQLDAGPGSPDAPLDQLTEALRRASRPTRDLILQRASEQRSRYWKGTVDGDKAKMERTIPIFRALLDTDQDRLHHIRGQLGFALKDKVQPDYGGAIEQLSEAIDLRDSSGETGWRFYEFNRALARILSESGTPEQILDDLCKAAEIDYIRGIIEKDDHINPWLLSQDVEPTKLRERCGGQPVGGQETATEETATEAADLAEAAAEAAEKADDAETAAAEASDAVDAVAAAAEDAAEAAADDAAAGDATTSETE